MTRLRVDLSGLHEAVRQMGAEPVDFSIEQNMTPLAHIDVELERGVELPDLSEVETEHGLLGYKGRQILLYIQDHGSYVVRTLEDGKRGNRFHVADCKKLKEMRARGRYERYVVTNRLDGEFYISGQDWGTRREIDGYTWLQVCQFCMGQLNYKGAQRDQARRRAVAQAFDIEEFFTTYSSFFAHLPSRHAGDAEQEGYTEDWSQVAARFKADRAFRCESCNVDLTNEKRLLHVHHKNGVKSDNHRSNLMALCAACHRAQADHGHMFVSHEEMRTITRLRQVQKVIGRNADWEEVFSYCDPALHGVLDKYRSRGKKPPEVGYDVQNETKAVVAELEIAWPREKFGVAIATNDIEAARRAGWTALTMKEALEAD